MTVNLVQVFFIAFKDFRAFGIASISIILKN